MSVRAFSLKSKKMRLEVFAIRGGQTGTVILLAERRRLQYQTPFETYHVPFQALQALHVFETEFAQVNARQARQFLQRNI